MNRTILSLAAALLAAPTLFASAAQACISCEYVPEVARSPAPSSEARSYVHERSYSVERERSRPEKRHIVKREPAAKAEKSVETADKAPIETQAKSENSSIASTAPAVAPATAKVELKAAAVENSSITLASKQTATADKAPVATTAQEASVKPVDCKKFFPSVGMTVSVPCE